MNRGGSLGNLLKVVIEDFFTHMTIISVANKKVKKHSPSFDSVLNKLHGPISNLRVLAFSGGICWQLQDLLLGTGTDFQRTSDCSISESVQGWVGCSFEQPNLLEGVPGHGRALKP